MSDLSNFPHPLNALVAFLKADPGVAAIASKRVFKETLPDVQVARMPRPVVIVRIAGGSPAYGSGYQHYSDKRYDVATYGYTPDAAYELWAAVDRALRQMQRNTIEHTVLYWARPSGGPNQMREPGVNWPGGIPDNQTHWPFVMSSWQVLAADITPEVIA